MTDGAAPVLEATGIRAGYGEVEILRDVSICVQSREIVSIIGPNGAGKSTLMKAIFGLVPVRSGRVIFERQDVTGLSPDRIVQRGLGYVPQIENVFLSLTVQENLEMGGFARRGDLTQRLDEMYRLFPLLAERRHERTSRLSGGQRQLVALARALMLDPRILLLDEPSASLSPKMVELVFEKVIEINAIGTAILMVEQNARHALSISHRAYVLAAGQNRLDGNARDLLDAEEVRRIYLGE